MPFTFSVNGRNLSGNRNIHHKKDFNRIDRNEHCKKNPAVNKLPEPKVQPKQEYDWVTKTGVFFGSATCKKNHAVNAAKDVTQSFVLNGYKGMAMGQNPVKTAIFDTYDTAKDIYQDTSKKFEQCERDVLKWAEEQESKSNKNK